MAELYPNTPNPHHLLQHLDPDPAFSNRHHRNILPSPKSRTRPTVHIPIPIITIATYLDVIKILEHVRHGQQEQLGQHVFDGLAEAVAGRAQSVEDLGPLEQRRQVLATLRLQDVRRVLLVHVELRLLRRSGGGRSGRWVRRLSMWRHSDTDW